MRFVQFTILTDEATVAEAAETSKAARTAKHDAELTVSDLKNEKQQQQKHSFIHLVKILPLG